ncbi:uncharacterized protein [Anabrus simplex]|uniref:uncharacterized protein n=1 Tax=Anabrus simplex TaxID=316456 RepID=UPI0035A26AAE
MMNYLVLLGAALISSCMSCSLPYASQNQNVSTEHMVWHEQYRYPYPLGLMELQGCLTITVDPGTNQGDVILSGKFSRVPLLKVTGTGFLNGSRLNTNYDGLAHMMSGPRNVVYTDNKDIYIDHYCMFGAEIATVFTSEVNPSDEVLQKAWEMVDNSSELDRSRFKRVTC